MAVSLALLSRARRSLADLAGGLHHWMAAFLAVVSIAAVLEPARGQDNLDLSEQRAFQAAVDRVAPSVVRIQTVGAPGRVGRVRLSLGATTGLVVDRDGYIASSTFNFLGGCDSILLELPDGSRKTAQLVATDHARMVVLLKIETDSPLAVPEIASESEMRVGQWAIGVGRTFEASEVNVSVGIISALGRVWGKAIQTDAAVSPNNYGGPLVDVRGRVLGVLVPLSPQEGAEIAGVEWYDSGIGFAVPAEHLQKVLPRLKAGEDLHPGLIGISFPAANPSTSDAVIAACRPNSPAYRAGLQPGDRIVQLGPRKIARAAEVKEELSRRYAGETVRMTVRRGGQQLDRELELVAKLEPYAHPFLGILPMRTAAGASERSSGVTVRYVYPGAPAAEAGIERGDLLVALAGEPIPDADHLRRRVSGQVPDEEVELQVRRRQRVFRVKVRLGRLPEDVPPDALPPAHSPIPSGAPRSGGADRSTGPQAGSIQLKIPEFENDAWAYVPENYDAAVRYGLIVWLASPGRFDWDELVARWKPYCATGGLILLAPKPAHADAWQMREVTLVRKLVDEVTSTYSVDPTRIVVGGHGAGGGLAYLVAFASRGLARAVAAVDAPMMGRPPENDPVHRLAFYVAWAGKCRDADDIEEAVARLRDMRYPVVQRDLGDQPRRLNPEELSELVRWIDTLDRI